MKFITQSLKLGLPIIVQMEIKKKKVKNKILFLLHYVAMNLLINLTVFDISLIWVPTYMLFKSQTNIFEPEISPIT